MTRPVLRSPVCVAGWTAAALTCLATACAIDGAAHGATLDSLTKIDALGYVCVREVDLEAAYAATGKKDGLVPQTCLPEPCRRALTRPELGDLMGREPGGWEWDRYYARYADFCVAETGGPWPGSVAAPRIARGGFWGPILRAPVFAAVSTPASYRGASHGSGWYGGVFVGGSTHEGDRYADRSRDITKIRRDVTNIFNPPDEPDAPAPVPVPAAGWMLALGMMGLAMVRKWRT